MIVPVSVVCFSLNRNIEAFFITQSKINLIENQQLAINIKYLLTLL